MNLIGDLLKKHSLRNTEVRRKVLELFQVTDHAVSHSHIEEQLESQFDRVTLYRTLKSFEENHLIHRILNDSGVVTYALCREQCHEHDHQHEVAHTAHHTHNHIHFKCEVCQLTFCLEQVGIPPIALPPHYSARSYQVLVTGICEKCQPKS